MKIFTQTHNGYRLTTKHSINLLTYKGECVTEVWKDDDIIARVVAGKVTRFKDRRENGCLISEIEYPSGNKRILDYNRNCRTDIDKFGNRTMVPIKKCKHMGR